MGGFPSIKKLKIVSFYFLFVSFIISCGLDTFYYLEPPFDDGHTTKYSADANGDRANYYFSFLTNETGDNASLEDSDFTFLGTEVYYKIYNNYSTMTSVQSAVDSLNSSSDVSAAATNLINTRGYKTLLLSPKTLTPLVAKTGKNRYVYIRLNSTDTEESIACYGSSAMRSYDSSDTSITVLGKPLRNIATGSDCGFDFNSDDDENPVPKSGDEDVNYSSTSNSGVWYVDMWAVSIGRDSSYSSSYSKLLHLGSITIAEEWYDD